MASQNFGYVNFGDTSSSGPPRDAEELRVILTINETDDGNGFYWSMNPGAEYVAGHTADEVKIVLRPSDPLNPRAHYSWRAPYLTINDQNISSDLYKVEGPDGDDAVTLELESGFPTGECYYTLHLHVWDDDGLDTNVDLDPELDIGM